MLSQRSRISIKLLLQRGPVSNSLVMQVLPCDPRRNAHTRSYSTPTLAVNPRRRKTATPHRLLSSNAHRLHLAAPAIVDIIRLNSPSLASFTPYSGSIDSQGPAWGSLCTHMHARSQPPFSTPTGAEGMAMPPAPLQQLLTSLIEVGSTAAYRSTPSIPCAESPCSSTPPSSPSMSIPSISRTYSTTASSSLPRTPPLHLTPLRARQYSRVPAKKKMNRETMPVTGDRKRAPSLRMSTYQRHDSSSSSCERPFSAFGRHNTERLDRITITPSRSPECAPEIPRSDSSSSPQSLAALESSSKFMRTLTVCASCGASGPDFPRCRRCGDSWCSRACRMTARREAGSDGDGVQGHGCKGIRTASE
jgi:hypothetical protein